MEIEPNNVNARIGKVNSLIHISSSKLLKSEKFENALEYFSKVLEIESENKQALNGKLKSYNSLGYKYLKLNNA